MTDKTILLLDMDNTIAEWYIHLRDRMIDIDKRAMALPVRCPTYNMIKLCADSFPEDTGLAGDMLNLQYEVRKAEGFYKNIPIMPRAYEAIKYLMSRYTIWLVTKPDPFNQTCVKDKVSWAIKNLPYNRGSWAEHILPVNDKTMIAGHALVDDWFPDGDGIQTWDKIIFHQIYNQHMHGPRIYTWNDDSVKLICDVVEYAKYRQLMHQKYFHI